MKAVLARPPENPLLAVQDVWVSYDRIDAVRGVSFQVGAGEIVTLIGANGALPISGNSGASRWPGP